MAVIFAVLAKRASIAILQAGMRYSGNLTLMLRADSTRFNACTRAIYKSKFTFLARSVYIIC